MRNYLTKIFCLFLLVALALPAAAQTTYTDRFTGSVVASIGKQPVVVATTAALLNLAYSQTIDGVTVSDHTSDGTGQKPDRVLVKNQTDQTTNGIYVVNNSGAWTRAQDFSGPSGVVRGQLIMVTQGTQMGFWELTTADPITIASTGGTSNTPSNLTFAAVAIMPANFALADAHIYVGNNTGTAVGQALSGDCSLADTGAITCTKTNGTSFTSAATAVPTNGLCLVATGGVWSAGSCTGPSGSGTVTIGTANQLAYYPNSTNSVSGLPSVASHVLTTNVSGVPSWTSALPNGTTASTQTAGDASTAVATDNFVATSFAPLANAHLTGVPTAPTAAASTNTTQIATTGFVNGTALTLTNGTIAATQTQADNSSKVATTAYADGGAIGVNQNWNSETLSRALGTTYTNSTGKPIAVSIYATNSSGSANLIVNINSAVTNYGSQGANFSNSGSSIFFIVPNGQTYNVSYSAGTGTVYQWNELR